MATDQELLEGSNTSYSGRDAIPAGYERVTGEAFVDPGTDARAELLTDGEGDYIVAFAGTGSIQDACSVGVRRCEYDGCKPAAQIYAT